MQRTVWHFSLTILLRRYGPSWVEVRDEVALSEERPRMDYLLLRKLLDPPAIEPDRVLRGLWGRLRRVTVAEFKSVSRPYRTRGLDRLWSYVHAYWAGFPEGLEWRDDLGALLLVPNRTPSLDEDARSMGLRWNDLGGGYWGLSGGLFGLHVAELDAVAEHEGDDLVGSFGHGEAKSLRARSFWVEQLGTKEAKMTVQSLEGYEEAVRRFLAELSPEQRLAGLSPEQRLAGLPPEQRLAGLPPEQRLAGLAPEQRLAGLPPEQRLAGLAPEQRLAGLSREERLLAMSDEELRMLREEFLATFSEATREAVRKRLGG
jgi:hypothetical protein